MCLLVWQELGVHLYVNVDGSTDYVYCLSELRGQEETGHTQ